MMYGLSTKHSSLLRAELTLERKQENPSVSSMEAIWISVIVNEIATACEENATSSENTTILVKINHFTIPLNRD